MIKTVAVKNTSFSPVRRITVLYAQKVIVEQKMQSFVCSAINTYSDPFLEIKFLANLVKCSSLSFCDNTSLKTSRA